MEFDEFLLTAQEAWESEGYATQLDENFIKTLYNMLYN